MNWDRFCFKFITFLKFEAYFYVFKWDDSWGMYAECND